ncbi:ABC-type phosphate/phosphonate transport system substrate-binding protein [Bradyrhizobium sp. AZCC 2262]|uniref:phosphate/phosphite/phosphonate ABC transporter substrate-binding protein n=1 Tax=Bradyrhizobium sp. AZCC 2262 TaxID=3117022 RepID=UPI002FEFEEE0
MYALPEMEAANAAFLAVLQQRLRARGIPEISFTQVCGYPLFKHDRDRYRMLATPHYAMPGCVGSSHRAFFMVRANDPAQRLEDLRGHVFGCNSLLSNSGMNLPRLSLARIAGGKPFFSAVVMTDAHVTSLERLHEGSIDICSVDNVTWGFYKKFRPVAAARFRILDETVSSPSLPFVTSANTTETEAVALAETLYEITRDPQLAHIREALELTGLSVPDVAAYERLADYEREAAELGFPEIK